ncbi:MAG: TolC family outer membrane protein [Gammaproteobacteria bacterium]|nr:TolC family outer membrane protein [Gammaproteobacteria bacterium]
MKPTLTLSIALASLMQFSVATASGQGLLDIYQKAVEQDPALAGAQFASAASEEKSKQGLSLLLPKMSASANVSYNHSIRDAGDGETTNTSDGRSIALQLSQPVFRSADYKSYSQSKIVSSQGDVQLKLAEQDLILRVSQAYFNVLSADENLQVAISQTKAFKESLERAKLTFKVGTATKTDKLEAQARFDLARASEISAQNQLAIANQSLASIIGEAPAKLKSLKTDAKLVELKANDIQHWVDTAISNNLQLQLINSGYKISQIEVSKLKSDRLPTLDFIANASNSKSFFISSNTTTTQASVALQLAMPIYTGGLMSSRIREAESLKSQQAQVKINTQRQVILQAQQSYLNSYNGLQQVSALRQALKSSNSALKATQKGVEVGVRTNLDLLDSQQQFFSTQRDYTFAKYNYLLSILNLKAAAGVLAKSDIENLDLLLK